MKRPLLPAKPAAILCRLLDRLTGLFLAFMLLLGLYTLCDTIYLYRNPGCAAGAVRTQDGSPPEHLPEGAVGWLTLNGTSVDYPVMQGRDNEEYLNRNPDGSYALSGSIFLDFRNAPDFSDRYNLIYGHHMSAGRMFGALDSYRDEDYFNAHRRGKLYAAGAGKKVYNLHVFALLEASSSEKTIFDAGEDGDADRVLSYVRRHALIYEEPALKTGSCRILALSTCRDAGATDRLIVLAVMSPASK